VGKGRGAVCVCESVTAWLYQRIVFSLCCEGLMYGRAVVREQMRTENEELSCIGLNSSESFSNSPCQKKRHRGVSRSWLEF